MQASPYCDHDYEKHRDRRNEQAMFRRLRRRSAAQFDNGWTRYGHGGIGHRHGKRRQRNYGQWRCRIDPGNQLGNRRTVGGIAIQTLTHDLCEFSRKSSGEQRGFGLTIGQRRNLPRERLKHGYAERPDIAGRRETTVSCFGRIVRGMLGDISRGFADGANGITRQFELILDDQHD